MKLNDFAKSLLLGESLEEKLISPNNIKENLKSSKIELSRKVIKPNRETKISFSDKQLKFPKKGSFHLAEKVATALHYFANHELLAIEMMAWALLNFDKIDGNIEKFRSGLLTTIADEQKHFKLYQARMEELGISFGDLPVNDFFWRQIENVKTPAEFYAVVALTFEQANLDFAKYYADVFSEVGDEKTSKIMNVIYEDEITHVALGAHWLNQWRHDNNLWEYYMNLLPEKMTPSRAKGIIFDRSSREKAGLKEEFIDSIREYSDDFAVTNRKEW